MIDKWVTSFRFNEIKKIKKCLIGFLIDVFLLLSAGRNYSLGSPSVTWLSRKWRQSGESLQNGQLELRRRNWYFAHKDTAISVWACQAGFWKSAGTSCHLRSKPHAVFHGVCKIALTEVLATQMGVMRRSKKVGLFKLYKLNPFSPHCGSIARELVHCYTWGRLRIVTVRGNTVGRHS